MNQPTELIYRNCLTRTCFDNLTACTVLSNSRHCQLPSILTWSISAKRLRSSAVTKRPQPETSWEPKDYYTTTEKLWRKVAFNLTPVYLMATTLRRVSKLSHGFLHVSTRNRKSELSLRLLIRKVVWTAQSNSWEDSGFSSANRKSSVPNDDYTE